MHRQRDCKPRGDEFLIILPDVGSDSSSDGKNSPVINRLTKQIVDEFERPFCVDDRTHYVTASVGIAIYPEHGNDASALLKNAETAMYQAKKQGKHQCQLFDKSINDALNKRIAIESALRGIEKRNELQLFYQPIIKGASNHIALCEALLRWQTHDGHFIMPDTFIPIAEDTGLITPIGKWIIERACQDLRYIHDHINPAMQFAINVSSRQLQEPQFSDYIIEQVERFELSPGMLKLEITESVVMNHLGDTQANLKKLCQLGFQLSIDDFGTGYSSLAYLQKYAFSELKIDRRFISQLEVNNNDAKLTEAIINMAHSLDMQVVAEGVENEQQQTFLAQHHCDFMQGYCFSRPVPFQALLEQLKI